MKAKISILLAILMVAMTLVPAMGAMAEQKEKVVFWYHDGNPTSNPILEHNIQLFEEKFPQYEVEYVGLPSDSYLQKYNIAVATNTTPDVSGIRDMDMSTFISQNALVAMDETFEAWDEKGNMSQAVLDVVRSTSPDQKLYCLPQYVTMDVSWANTKLMGEKGVALPATIAEFVEDCKQFADPTNNKYFYSLRGGAGSMENLFDFIFTYANKDSIFDESGNCVLTDPKFAEAMDLYCSIYWDGLTSRDSVTNGFKEIVAEFGSGTSMFLSHNSSSLPEHKKNLGEGNFMNVMPFKNDQGITVTKALSFVGYGVWEGAKNKQGGIELAKFLAGKEASSYHCQNEGRIPVNGGVYEEEWYKNDPYLKVYEEMVTSENVKFLSHAIWLPQWNDFRSKLQEPDLQAVILKKKTSAEALQGWADYLTKAQQEYLAASK